MMWYWGRLYPFAAMRILLNLWLWPSQIIPYPSLNAVDVPLTFPSCSPNVKAVYIVLSSCSPIREQAAPHPHGEAFTWTHPSRRLFIHPDASSFSNENERLIIPTRIHTHYYWWLYEQSDGRAYSFEKYKQIKF